MKSKWNKELDKEEYPKLIKTYKTIKVIVATGRTSDFGPKIKSDRYFTGSSVLLQLSKYKFVFIGDSVYEFKITDEVVKFYSLVGGNDVPYPVIVGTTNVYFMLDKKICR